MSRFADFGNALHSGRTSYPFVDRAKRWLAIVGVLVLLSLLVPVAKGGFNLGIDFLPNRCTRGGGRAAAAPVLVPGPGPTCAAVAVRTCTARPTVATV